MRILVSISMLFILMACASTATDTGSSAPSANYGTCGVLHGSFVGEWFDYYKRAITYMDCEKWPEAEDDLRQALRVRSVDKRRVYTSGMHFLKNYFPNRELAITLSRQGKTSEALKYFQTSYRQFPTAKNRYFWIEALRHQAGAIQDTSAPVIRLQNHTKNAWVLGISDTTYIDYVEVAGQRYPLLHSIVVDDESVGYTPLEAQQTITIEKTSLQSLGVDVVAVDVFGQKQVYNTETDRDKRAPDLKLVGGAQSGQQLSAAFIFTDESGIAGIQWAGQTLTHADLLRMPADQIDVEDGLVVRANVTIKTQQPATAIKIEDRLGNSRVYTLSADKVFSNDSIAVYFSDLPPVTQEHFALLEAEVSAGNGISQLQINGKTVSTTNELSTTITQLVPLKLGNNLIAVSVEDGNGQRHSETIEVTRELPPAFKFGERLRLALVPFDCQQASSAECLANDHGFDSLYKTFNERRRFQLTSRNFLEEALIESAYCEFATSTECIRYLTEKFGTDDAQQIRMTQQSLSAGETAQAILVVDIERRPLLSSQLDSVDIAIKVIQANTGELLITFSNYEEIAAGKMLNIEAIASKVHSFFPILEFTMLSEQRVTAEAFSLWKNMPVMGKATSVCYMGKLEQLVDSNAWQLSKPHAPCKVSKLMSL